MKRNFSFLPAAFLLLAAAPAFSQPAPVVLPDKSLATTPGNTNNNIPFSWYPTRYQQIFDNKDVGPANIFQVLQMRPNKNFAKPSYGGQMVLLEIKLGNTTVGWASPSSVFSTNNPSPTTVLAKKWVLMPKFRAFAPGDWQVTVPFDRPWPWSGKNNLCVEVVNWGNTNNNKIFTYPLDAVSSSSGVAKTCRVYASGNPTASSGSVGRNYGLIMRFSFRPDGAYLVDYGKACPGSSGKGLLLTGKEAPRIGQPFTLGLRQAPANTPAFYTIGASSTNWGPFQLPLDLSKFGATGCALNASIIVMFGTKTGPAGTASATLSYPNVPSMVGASLYFQWLAVDQQANGLGLITSQGGRAFTGK